MPSDNTITTFYDFAAGTKAKSSQVDANFALIRGHWNPIDGSTTSFADNAYDLGKTDAQWRNLYIKNLPYIDGVQLTDPSTIETSSFAGRARPELAQILTGCRVNTAEFTRKRIGIHESALKDDPDGFNRWIGNSVWQAAHSTASNSLALQEKFIRIQGNSQVSFRMARGENYFGVLYHQDASTSSDVEVFVDNTTLTAFGEFKDQFNDTIASATFSTNDSIDSYTRGRYFFGFDGDEHTITLKNTDATASAWFELEGIEVGYRTPESIVAIGHTDVRLESGRAVARAKEVSITTQLLSFSTATGYGRSDCVAVDTSGNVTVIEGVEPAFTTCPPQVALSVAAANIKVRSNMYFDTAGGFCLVSTAFGEQRIISYSGVTNGTHASYDEPQLTGVLWSSPFAAEITPRNWLETNTAAEGTYLSDIWINQIAAGGFNVTAGNQKLDFTIQEDNTSAATTFVATIPTGRYSADLLPLGTAIRQALQSAKALPEGTYFCDYDHLAQKWKLGVRGADNITAVTFPFSTGANQSNSIHGDLGFDDTDLSGALEYEGNNEVAHLAKRAFDIGYPRQCDDPAVQGHNNPTYNNLNLNFVENLSPQYNQYRRFKNALGVDMPIHSGPPDQKGSIDIVTEPDSVGIIAYVMRPEIGSQIGARLDNGERVLIAQGRYDSASTADVDVPQNQVVPYMMTFARGSHHLRLDFPYIGLNNGMGFQPITEEDRGLRFLGFEELKSHVPLEALSLTQAALKGFDIAPKSMKRIKYGSHYTPTTNDNLDSFTEGNTGGGGGAWSTDSTTTALPGQRKRTSTKNDYVDITFTLQGDGGGISMEGFHDLNKDVRFYLNATGTGDNSSTKLIHRFSQHLLREYDSPIFEQLGLPSGQYTLRMLIAGSATNAHWTSVNIFDTVDPQPGAVVIDEMTNTGIGLGYPAWGSHATTDKWGYNYGGFKAPVPQDRQSLIDYNAATYIPAVDQTYTTQLSHHGFGHGYLDLSANGSFLGIWTFARSIYPYTACQTAASSGVRPELDGTNLSNFDCREGLKGSVGSLSDSAGSYFLPQFRKYFQQDLSGDMSAGALTFIPLSSITGMRIGQKVAVSADSQTTVYRRITDTTATGIVVNKDITAGASFTTGNNAAVDFGGLHALRLTNQTATTVKFQGIGYEPLPVMERNLPEPLKGDRDGQWKLNAVDYRVGYTSISSSFLTLGAFNIETQGNPVMLLFSGYLNIRYETSFEIQRWNANVNSLEGVSTPSTSHIVIGNNNVGAGNNFFFPAGTLNYVDAPAAGFHRYQILAEGATTAAAQLLGGVKITAIEIPNSMDRSDINALLANYLGKNY